MFLFFGMDSTNAKGEKIIINRGIGMESEKIQDIKKFESIVSHGITLVDFNAPWCAPCRVQYPIIEELSEDF